MALDDFAPQGSTPVPTAPAKKPAPNEDEDLFDFPVLEMKFESEGEKKPAAAPAPAAAAAAAPAASAASASAPEAAGKPGASASAPAAAKTAPLPAPKAEAASVKTSAASAPKSAAKDGASKGAGEPKSKGKDVAKAAQLVSDIEEALVSDGRARGSRKSPFGAPSLLVLAGLGALLLVNLGGLLFLWRSTQTFQSGVSAMNDQLVHALQVQALTRNEPAPDAHAPAALTRSEHGASTPLESFEETTLGLAREEIQAGEYAAARRRLARLLAAADRMGAEEREEIEAQAAFLFASTYRKQAEAAREKQP